MANFLLLKKFSMRTLICLALIACFVAWLNFPLYYFVWGPTYARLPQHIRMSASFSKPECESLAQDFHRVAPNSGVFCERVPRWKHLWNLALNVTYQLTELMEPSRR